MTKKSSMLPVTRRQVIKAGGAALAVGGLGTVIGAPAIAANKAFKIGYVSPETGPLAAFGEADAFVLDIVRKQFKDGVKVGGKMVPVDIIVKDSQSNPNRAAEVAADLILKDNVDLMLSSSTPETTNPVSDQAETNEVPSVSTMCPWQPWFFSRGGKPDAGFKYTYHFFWGLEGVTGAFLSMWEQLPTNKQVGGLFPNDGDGNAWGDPAHGIKPALDKQGYKLVDPGRYSDMTDNFSAQIGAFKNGNCEIVTGVVIPPDVTTFLKQAKQQGYNPKIASIGKGLLFPVVIDGIGEAANNLSCEVWWAPSFPFKSSFTGESCKQLADAYTAATKRQWSQHIGFAYSLFEVAADVIKRSQGPGQRDAVLDAVAKTKLDTIVGPIGWGGPGPFKNVSTTPVVGGQWRNTKGGPFKHDLVIVSNPTKYDIPVAGKVEAYS
jgi:branched-chain amino acid transport system substrate-binding protein